MTNENENAGKEYVRMSMWAPGMILAAADAIINTTHYPHANSGISPAAQYSQGPAPRPAPVPASCSHIAAQHNFIINFCSSLEISAPAAVLVTGWPVPVWSRRGAALAINYQREDTSSTCHQIGPHTRQITTKSPYKWTFYLKTSWPVVKYACEGASICETAKSSMFKSQRGNYICLLVGR